MEFKVIAILDVANIYVIIQISDENKIVEEWSLVKNTSKNDHGRMTIRSRLDGVEMSAQQIHHQLQLN